MAETESTLLNAHEVRVLGSLIEKEITTAEYYPIRLSALTAACNQTSNREPVMDLEEYEVMRALESLRDKRLANLFKGADSRVPKYSHRFAETDVDLSRPEISLLCNLMLRGPQTLGELRTRSARMHEFESLDEVEKVLEYLSTRPSAPLVVKLPRQAGYKEQRYMHLFSGAPIITETTSEIKTEATLSPLRVEPERVLKLETEVAALKAEIETIKAQFSAFRKQLE
jgi:uncharacterized protein YceH (UPF0502 family)